MPNVTRAEALAIIDATTAALLKRLGPLELDAVAKRDDRRRRLQEVVDQISDLADRIEDIEKREGLGRGSRRGTNGWGDVFGVRRGGH